MSNEAPVDFVIPSSPADREKIIGAVKEAMAALDIIESTKDKLKGIRAMVKEELGMPTDLFNELVKTHYSRALEVKRMKNERLIDTYEALFGDEE